jgi:beta-lactam-binding protein with PASTA domain
VPVLIGLSQQQAEDLLLERDLVWELRELEIQDPSDPRIDVVFEQSLGAGDEVDKGASITFVVGRLVAPTTTEVTTSTSVVDTPTTSSTSSTTTSAAPTSSTSSTTSTTVVAEP